MKRYTKWIIIAAGITGAVLIIIANLFFYYTEDERLQGIRVNRSHVYGFRRNYHELYFKSIEGGMVHAVLFPVIASKGVLLFFPGTHSEAEHSYNFIGTSLLRNYDLLIVEYRNSGKSEGMQSERTFHYDAQLIYDSMKLKYEEKNILLCGFSLGGPIAARLAANNNPGALLMIAPLYSINAKYAFKPWHYRKYKFETFRDLAYIKCRIDFFCGTEDGLYDDTRRLYDLSAGKSNMHSFPNEGHLSIFKSPAFKESFNNALP
jgi:uncharacterized protein